MNGILLIDKPSGPSSHDIVARIRRISRERRVGHTGTLDPFATGLLILCIGRATRLARFLSAADKTYIAAIRFGNATDTYDRTGNVVGDVTRTAPDRELLSRLVAELPVIDEQVPPPWSAKKVDGKRAYQLARAGQEVSLAPVPVQIRKAKLQALDGTLATLLLSVSTGTYIRSIAHDLGEKTGLGGHLEELRRTAVGEFSVAEAASLVTLEERGVDEFLVRPSDALRHLPRGRVDGEALHRLQHGRPARLDEVELSRPPRSSEEFVQIVAATGDLVAVCKVQDACLRPAMVWAMPESH